MASRVMESKRLGNGLTSIPTKAFYHCSSLETIVIPDNVTAIGQEVFSEREGLREAVIGDGVEEIGSNVFKSCENLEKVNIPGQVFKIEEGAFNICTNLKEVTIGAGVEMIKSAAFGGCQNLADIYYGGRNREAVATVDQEGNVKGIAAGSATITAALNGKTASCEVTVRRASNGGGSSSGGSSSGGSSSKSSSSTSGVNTWTQDTKGWRYKKGDNTWASNGWQRIDGKWYYFNEVSDGTRGALMINTQMGEYYVNQGGVWAK